MPARLSATSSYVDTLRRGLRRTFPRKLAGTHPRVGDVMSQPLGAWRSGLTTAAAFSSASREMLAASSSHKRRRSATRADAARAAPCGRVIAAVHRGEVLAPLAHPFNHAVRTHVSKLSLTVDRRRGAEYRVCAAGPRRAPQGTVRHSYGARHSLPCAGARDALSGRRVRCCVCAYRQSVCSERVAPRQGRCHVPRWAGYVIDTLLALLTATGMLILSLTKETYQTLGLVGRPSRYAHGASGRMGDRQSGPISRYGTCAGPIHTGG